MILAQVAATIAVLLVCSIGPGLFVVRRLHWRPLETLCGAVALSFLLLYVTAFAIYLLNLPPGWADVPVVLAAYATGCCSSDLHRLWRHRETRSTILAFFALLAWLLSLLSLARNYSGAAWYWDWWEHWQRTLFFSTYLPPETHPSGYVLPARPPMMNLLAAQIVWQVSDQFWIFQVACTFLNALVILPCALIAPALVTKTRHRAWFIAAFFALSPMVVQNGTYSWTKAFAAFYSLVGLGLYLSAWRRNDRGRLIAAVGCLSTAMLVHYSAAPMLLFLAGHYLIFLFRRRADKWRELIAAVAFGAGIFATWLAWSLHAFGIAATFGSNTAVTSSKQFSLLGNVIKIASNVFHTLVPYPLRGPYIYIPNLPPRSLAEWRDMFFAIYQTEFPAMLGLGGLILIGWQFVRMWRERASASSRPSCTFWLWFVVVVTFLGIAVVGEADYLGLAHLCLQPLVLLCLTFAAVSLPQVSIAVRTTALAGLLVDAAVGVLLHIHVERREFAWSTEGGLLHPVDSMGMNALAVANAGLKYQYHPSFLADHAIAIADFLWIVAVLGTLAICSGLWLLASRGAGSRNASRESPTVQPRQRV